MKATVNIIKDLVDVISATVIITNATDNLDGTFTLESENTYWLSKDDTITIDSETYVVTQFSQNIEFTIMPTGNGGLPTVDSFELQQPTYIHGTLRMAKNEVNAIKNKMDLVPFVYLYEVIRDKKNTDEASAIDRETILRIFFLNSSSFKDMLTEDVYEYIINPMQTMVDEFLNKVKNSRYFTENMDYETIPLVNFSDEGEQQKSIFDINLSGIELRLSAEIRKDLSCTDYIAPTPPTPTCLDAELIINETTEISIGSGEIFDLSVTLDGNPSGTYNALTDTWEVESEPCPPCEIDITFDSIPLGTATTSPYNIDCSTYLNVAIVTGSGLDGNYMVNVLNQYVLDNIDEYRILYDNIEGYWVLLDMSGILLARANTGNEPYPWLATWSTITVEEGTIANYCGGGVCADATYDIKDSANTTLYSGSIVSGGSLDQTITDSVATLKDSANATISTTNLKAQESKNITAPDGVASNSDASYSENVKSNGTLALPDITITKPDATTVSFPSVKNVDIRDYKSDICYNRPNMGGQVSLVTYDDGWVCINRPTPNNPLYPTHYARLDYTAAQPFLTLVDNNIHGNKLRFTNRVGGTTYTVGIVQDHLTGLEWSVGDYGTTDYSGALSGGATLNFGGNTDWWNARQCDWQTIVNNNVSRNLNYAPFNNNTNTLFFTSTSDIRNSANAIQFLNNETANYFVSVAKTLNTRYYKACRWFA